MKKSIYLLATVVLSAGLIACSKKEEKKPAQIGIIDVTQEADEDIKSESKSEGVTQETTVVTSQEDDNQTIELGTSDCYKSEKKANENCPFKDKLPSGITPEITYYMYDELEGILMAQSYIEKIGVTTENKQIVLLSGNDVEGGSLLFQAFHYDEDAINMVEHYFISNKMTYESRLAELGDRVDFTDANAMYIRTKKSASYFTQVYEDLLMYFEKMDSVYTIVK